MVSAMNRQRTNVRARYYRCPARPAPARPPVRTARRRVGLLVALLPWALVTFTGLAVMSAGLMMR